VLGVTIDNKGVKFGCNHCDWTGGDFFDLLNRRHARKTAAKPIVPPVAPPSGGRRR
jgi:hypothetical protein